MHRTINRCLLVDVIVSDACRTVESALLDGLALDVPNRKIYYADAGNVGKIGEVSFDGTHHRVLVTELESKPRSIVLDPSNRYTKIEQSGSFKLSLLKRVAAVTFC